MARSGIVVDRIVFVVIQDRVSLSSIFGVVKAVWLGTFLGSFRFRLFDLKRSGVSSRVTLSLMFNAVVSYSNQISLEFYGLSSDLACYSLCFQLFSIVSIFQGTALRLISRQINESAGSGLVIRRDIVKKALLMAGASALLALMAIALLKFGLAMLGSPWDLISISLLGALGVWVVVVGWGQVITRYLLAMGFDSKYLVVSGLGALTTILAGLYAVPKYGAEGVAYTLLVVHSIMIFYYTFSLFRLVRRSSS